MKQWCVLYVLLCSYEFVIWLNCFVGHFMSWWCLARIWSSGTWHAALLVCLVPYWRLTHSKCVFAAIFSVAVCLRGLYYHILLATAIVLRQDQCAPHAGCTPPPPPPPHGMGWIDLRLSISAGSGGVVGLILGSVFIIALDAELAGIYFHWYCTLYHYVCHKQDSSGRGSGGSGGSGSSGSSSSSSSSSSSLLTVHV